METSLPVYVGVHKLLIEAGHRDPMPRVMDYATGIAKKLSRFDRGPGQDPGAGVNGRLPLAVCIPLITAVSLALWLTIATILRWVL